ncbi:hypothetical protein DWB85_18150 [Seongchinamella sediminis]|uniref:Uncharacterized protein n=1 Tax=Seongchinamella sediminis TaxID=2283635 RepID=A0A3L7DU61_9GAMM|nr:DUF5329 family protein [Seongchinamella sediminis]RLQ20315.1 hypothetical protein DWB85_18150 [Seongchinamella sediminis]
MTRTALLAFSLLLATTAAAADNTDTEVQYLLNYVATSGCTFHRNGSDHDAADAADHLRLKYRRGGKYVDTTEHFIDRLATESSWTGRQYSVTCAGHTRPSAEWLHEALADYRAKGP